MQESKAMGRSGSFQALLQVLPQALSRAPPTP